MLSSAGNSIGGRINTDAEYASAVASTSPAREISLEPSRREARKEEGPRYPVTPPKGANKKSKLHEYVTTPEVEDACQETEAALTMFCTWLEVVSRPKEYSFVVEKPTARQLVTLRTSCMAVCVASQPFREAEIPSLDSPISESSGSYFPQVSINVARALSKRRLRSFGDLLQVTDTDLISGTSSSDEDATDMSAFSPDAVVQSSSLLDSVLLAEWEDRHERGLFRYDVTACPTKAVAGAYGFIAQLNEGRGSKKRPTEFTADKAQEVSMLQVCQPYDPKRFNFTKVPQKEVLFQLDETAQAAGFEHKAAFGSNPNLVLINVSPIEYGHVLMVPRVLDHLPQVVDTKSLLLALHFCREAQNPYFRLCYNSLGAYATVNHLHFQAYYLAAPFAVERAPTKALLGHRRRKDVEVALLCDYPVKGLVFEAGESLTATAHLVGAACKRLQDANIPHNILVVDCGQRLFLFPNNYSAAKAAGSVPDDLLDTQVDPATFEIAGHLILKRSEDYSSISQAWIWRLLSFACLPDNAFQTFLDLALKDD